MDGSHVLYDSYSPSPSGLRPSGSVLYKPYNTDCHAVSITYIPITASLVPRLSWERGYITACMCTLSDQLLLPPVAQLLYFCTDANPREGLFKALSVAVREHITPQQVCMLTCVPRFVLYNHVFCLNLQKSPQQIVLLEDFYQVICCQAVAKFAKIIAAPGM